jgi:hypothetical protein
MITLEKPDAALTPEQQLKRIFLHLEMTEKLPEPTRTKHLRRLIETALDDLSHVKMP